MTRDRTTKRILIIKKPRAPSDEADIYLANIVSGCCTLHGQGPSPAEALADAENVYIEHHRDESLAEHRLQDATGLLRPG